MGFLNEPIPNWLQWVGLIAGLAATGLTTWAALSARGARQAAQAARRAAERAGNELQLLDLIEDVREIEGMVARREFESIASKANRLRARIVRFKQQTYNDLLEPGREKLDASRETVQSIERHALNSRISESTRIQRISDSLGRVSELLSTLAAILRVPL
jgi:DNA anti-recombination protein RmuC